MLTIRKLFYVCWVISLLAQAYFTELLPDEAYYWMYAQDLAWGYFDHPPFVALWIKLGCWLLPGELGVRFFPIILSALTIYVMELLINPKHISVYYMLVSSIAVLHFFGFLALPDSSLLFFATLFIYLYKKFLEDPDFLLSLIMGVSLAAMLLSKYHGVIIPVCVIFANPGILKNKKFWLAIGTAICLVIPHLWWQFKTGFPSINYHFFERSTQHYQVSFTLEYLATQLFVLGPLTGVFLFIAAYKQKVKNVFEKTLHYLFWGIYLFFFLMTFKGRVEGHWTLLSVIPGLYVGYRFFSRSNGSTKLLRTLFFCSVILIGIVRLFLALNLDLPTNSLLWKLSHKIHHKETMLAIKEHAGDKPVAFMNSYQKASLYSFYAASEGFTINNIMGRKNQFNIWQSENKYRGQSVFLIPNYDVTEFDTINGVHKRLRYTIIDNFQSYSCLKIYLENFPSEARPNDTINIKAWIHHELSQAIDLEANKSYPSSIYYQFFDGKKLVKEKKALPIANNAFNQTLTFSIETPEKPGNYKVYFSIKTGWLPPTINSQQYELKVVPD